MELVNATRLVAGYTMGLEPSGRELLVVAVKGTFLLPAEADGRVELHAEQVPLVLSDVFVGEPGLSAPKFEVDFAPRKQRCDLLLNGHAYAPGGQPTDRLTVGVRVGTWSKTFAVVGDRFWRTAGGVRATPPRPFVKMALSYDYAFGGVDLRHENPQQHGAFMANPAGRGYHRHLTKEWLEGTPLPNTEEVGSQVTQPDGVYRPMSFGIVGRHWESRSRFAGTYDQQWLDNVAPFLPADFDEQYYQAAPLDQQLPLPVGEQRVSLVNLTPDGRRDFTLPHFEAPITVVPKTGPREELRASADTILIEPDLDRVTMTWRVARPLKKSMFEIAQVLVGRKGNEWWQQRQEFVFPIPLIVQPVPEADDVEADDNQEAAE